MGFLIGDQVIHWTYGLGEISQIEQKTINGQLTTCYVFKTADLMIWIPIDDLQQSSLRAPTPAEEFDQLFAILSGPTEELLEDRQLRKSQLMTQLKDGKLASTCRVVRDLTHYERTAKLSDQERSLLERATRSLLLEWSYSLGISMNQAHQAMTGMLGG
jgi:RNA polymerase-interacting CarD/CdnL/TRCF family regulator